MHVEECDAMQPLTLLQPPCEALPKATVLLAMILLGVDAMNAGGRWSVPSDRWLVAGGCSQNAPLQPRVTDTRGKSTVSQTQPLALFPMRRSLHRRYRAKAGAAWSLEVELCCSVAFSMLI